MPNHLASKGEEEVVDTLCVWAFIPDNLLLMVFSQLKPQSLLTAAQVCKQWNRVALDELLWKALLYRCWSIPAKVPRTPGKTSWLAEFKRLHYEIPKVESEVIAEHRDQVLHVTFSHNGKMFSSCSKDGYVKVWNATYPASLKYYADMKEMTWKYTQFSQFNDSDTLLLVSGVHFGSNSTSGEIVVFNLSGDKFELQCRVLNKPYDVFGTWYNNGYLLSGNIHWLGNYTSCSVLWLNKAEQALESQHESVVMCMYKFLNIKASSVRTIMVAECIYNDNLTLHTCQVTTVNPAKCLGKNNVSASESPQEQTGNQPKKIKKCCVQDSVQTVGSSLGQGQIFGTIQYGNEYRQAQGLSDAREAPVYSLDLELDMDSDENSREDPEGMALGDERTKTETSGVYEQWYADSYGTKPEKSDTAPNSGNSLSVCTASKPVHQSPSSGSLSASSCYSNVSTDSSSQSASSANQTCPKCNASLIAKLDSARLKNKYLIFTMGTKTYTPHQIGIKLISAEEASQNIETMVMRKEEECFVRSLSQRDRVESSDGDEAQEGAGPNGPQEENDLDTVDHLIELHGHIIGMCLSPNQRYLYVNSRPWPKNYVINDPLYPPPIAQEIDIHVIDLLTMDEVGTMHRAHKAYTPNDECFFIFLDVSSEYVASGAENCHGYLWDRHYGVCLAQYPHKDVVNCVAFNPCDQQVMITASDDHTLKIWRSRHRQKQIDRSSAKRGS